MSRTVRTLLFVAVLVALPAAAHAFCGFYVGGGDAKLYNDATQVVLVRDDDTTVLSMQNNYEGPPKNFAMVVPVPEVLQKENVKTLQKDVFDRIDTLSAPRLVEYWERDPCYKPPPKKKLMRSSRRKRSARPEVWNAEAARPKVKIEAQFEVGEYEIVILSATEAAALDTWLREENYEIPKGAEPYLRPYVEGGMYFFVARVNLDKVKYVDGEAVLSPLRFHYESEEFSLPIRLGMINSKGQQDLLVYILSKNQRYRVANHPNETIPTNVEVNPSVKDDFAGFYDALFQKVHEAHPEAVITEYAWSASKCDPCPPGIKGGSALRRSDFLTLGGDVVGVGSSGRRARRRRRAPPRGVRGWTLTRLHARYPKGSVAADFVFEKAGPIVGGREVRDDQGRVEKGATEGSQNNFQGRYIIRHEWTGDVDCDDPKFGVWGGPPDERSKGPGVSPARSKNTRGAKAKETKPPASLNSLLAEGVESLGIPEAEAAEPSDESGESSEDGSSDEEESATSGGEAVADESRKQNCSGCVTSTDSTPGAAGLLFVLALFAARRRVDGASNEDTHT